jgi:hypothetical protein
VPADVAPTKKGSPAKFSWQTLLVLRLALTLRDDFNLELEAHREAFAVLKLLLLSHSFIALWGARIALSCDGVWMLVESGSEPPADDAVLLRLDPHLQALSEGAAALELSDGPRQLDLFTLPVRHPRRESATPMPSPVSERRRRSA